MNFAEFFAAMFGPLKRLTDFSGRSTRPEFWPFMFLLYAGQQIVTWIAMNPFMQKVQKLTDPVNPRPPEEVGPEILAMITGNIRPFFMLVGALAAISMAMAAAVTVRRLHDSNRSGFHALPIPFLQISSMTLMWMIMEELMAAGELRFPTLFFPLLFNNLLALAVTIYVLVLCALDGTIGPNRFGEDPKGRTVEEEEAKQAERAARQASAPTPAMVTRPDRGVPNPARVVDSEE